MADYLVTITSKVKSVDRVKHAPNAVTAGSRARDWDGSRNGVEKVSTSSDLLISAVEEQ
jgi:hypothetical protein